MNSLSDHLASAGDLFASRRQSAIYLALLKCGTSGIENLRKMTGIHAETIQREIVQMAKKGTIIISKPGRNKKIQAVPISKLQEILEASKDKFDFILKPLLEAVAESTHPRVNVFMGSHAFGQLQTKLLKLQPEGKDIHVISAHPDNWLNSMIESGKLSQFEKLRIEKMTVFKLSCFTSFRGQVEYNNRVYFRDEPTNLKRKYRYVQTADSSPLQIQIWQNHTVVSIFSSTPSIHIVFEDKNIKNAFGSYFDILWKFGIQ